MIEFICSANDCNQFPASEKEVVFVGRSNAGKSSLINCLYKKKLAYTGKMPGKTKMINFFDIDGRYTAVDVPGYGYARRSNSEAVKFGSLMEAYFKRNDIIRITVMIVDARIGLTKDDLDMKEFLEERKIPYVLAVNKIDKLSNNQLANQKRKVFQEYPDAIYVSALKRTNMDLLKAKIEESVSS